MSKILKWEFKESSKNYLVIAGLMTLAIIGLWAFIGFSMIPYISSPGRGMGMQAGRGMGMHNRMMSSSFALTLVFLTIFGLSVASAVSFYINIIKNYTEDLYGVKGLVKFTLPVSMNQYLSVKYLIPVLWTIILAGLFLIENFILSQIMAKFLFQDLEVFMKMMMNWRILLASAVSGLVTVLFFIAVMYFFITLYKAFRPNDNSPAIGAVIGFISLLIYSSVQPFIPSVFGRLQMNFVTRNFTHTNELGNYMLTVGPQSFNLDDFILKIILIVLCFIGTTSLLKKKIDL